MLIVQHHTSQDLRSTLCTMSSEVESKYHTEGDFGSIRLNMCRNKLISLC